jgi:hypothetical protein
MEAKELNDTLGKFAAEQRAFAQRERILDRIEREATTQGLHSDYVEDARAYVSRKADDGEDIGTISTQVAKLKASKPRYFTASPTAKNAQSVDHMKSSRQEYTNFMARFAPGIHV